MAAYSLLLWVLSTLILAPLSSSILQSLATYDDVIVGNYSIHSWLMSPKGMGYLLLAGSGVLFTFILQASGLFRIADGDARDLRSSAAVLLDLAGSAHHLVRISLGILGGCLLGGGLVAIGPGLAYLFLLTGHDINYYLTHHPPAWYTALGLAAVWALPLVTVAAVIIFRCRYALPAWLDGHRPFRRALRMSWKSTARRSKLALRSLVGWGVMCLLVSSAINGGLFWISGYLLGRVDTLETLVAIIAGTVVLSWVSTVVVGFLAMAWGVSVWVECYRDEYRGERSGPPAARALTTLSAAARVFRPKILVPVMVMLVAGSVGWSAWILGREVAMDVPLVIAHRAGLVQAPENSVAAMRQVLASGASDLVEIDVTLTGDGVLVVAHDRDLMKLAGDPRIIAETSFADLQTADIGIGHGPSFAGERLARLTDFLELSRDRIPLIVEFKHGAGTPLVERTLETVQASGLEDNVILMSLELEEVRAVQALAPDVEVGYFVTVQIGDLSQLDVAVLGVKHSIVTPAFLRDVHAEGMSVYAWTVNEPIRMLELIEIGVDGLITDDPILAAEVVGKVESLSPSLRLLLRFRQFWEIIYELGWWNPETGIED